MVSKEVFAQYIKEALERYYDTVRLQISPLTDLLQLVPDPGETRPARLRRLLRETIDALEPPPTVPYGARESLSYRLLWMHFIQSRSQFEISDELGLSRTSYYRYMAEALDAATSTLWDRYESVLATPSQTKAAQSEDTEAVEHAIRLSDCSDVQRVCLAEVIEDVLQTLAPLEARQGVTVCVSSPEPFPDTHCNPVMLRRILLTVLTEAIQGASGDSIDLSVTVSKAGTVWRILGLTSNLSMSEDSPMDTGLAVSRGLLAACGGHLWLDKETADRSMLCFALPVAHARAILIVDDDPDTTELYTRYLRGESYRVLTARTASDVRAQLADDVPDLVLLDVLLPGEDGWNILQQIKVVPETAHIPVIVCSVLSQPLLALALGATEVLTKPVGPEALLQAITKALSSPSHPG
jgi:CheY-like chemotaxis protein